MRKKIIGFITTITLMIVGCQTSPEIKDVIPPLKVVSGIPDSVIISDLYYSEKYDLKVKSNPVMDLMYNSIERKLHVKTDSEFEGMTLIEFESDMNVYHIPVISKKEKLYDFFFTPGKTYDQLTLFGSFNGWDRTSLPMTDNDGDGTFNASVALDPGVYQYKFYGDGLEIEDPLNSERVSNGVGGFNSIRTIDDPEIESFVLHLNSYSQNGDQFTYSFFLEDETDGIISGTNIFALLNNSEIDKEQVTIKNKLVSVSLNEEELNGSNTLRIAISKHGRVSNIQTVQLFDGIPANNQTFTWKDGIIYSLMIDRFNDGNSTNSTPVKHDSLFFKANYNGGDLRGIIDKLEEGYFEGLGVNIIWISPVYDNPDKAYKEYPAPHRYYSGYHGYWPTSAKTVDEHFGNLNEVKEFISKAHERGIKVLLDFVSNHVHEEHPYFKQNRDWFGQLELPDGRLNLRFWDEYRLTTWFEPYLPSFDYLSSEEALEEMTDVAVWWLKETGADGYRHDAVKHVPNKFWRRLNEKIRAKVSFDRDLEVYQIGETFGSYELISSYVNNGQLNSQFNFNLYDVAIPTFTREGTSFSTLDKEMHKTFSVYGVNHLMGNVMDSHDKNRFMAYADGDLDPSQWSAIEIGWNNPPQVDNPNNYKKLILYMAYMNSIPGLPVVYYGSEFGMSGASDPDNRRMMRFNDQLSEGEKSTLEEVSKIINLRKQHPALRHGDFYTLRADENIYAFIRSDMNERVLVILNKGNSDQDLKITLPQFYKVNEASDLLSSEIIDIDDSILKTKITPLGWRFYNLK